MRTRKRRAPRMRQRTPGKEKKPGRGLETGLDPKENKATGCEEGPGQEKPPVPAFPGAPDEGIPASDTSALTVTWFPQVSS